MSGRQRWVYLVEPCEFPDDFPERLERLRAARGLSWRGLARELRVSVRNLRRWRSGGRVDGACLLRLVSYAGAHGLLDCFLPELQGTSDDGAVQGPQRDADGYGLAVAETDGDDYSA